MTLHIGSPHTFMARESQDHVMGNPTPSFALSPSHPSPGRVEENAGDLDFVAQIESLKKTVCVETDLAGEYVARAEVQEYVFLFHRVVSFSSSSPPDVPRRRLFVFVSPTCSHAYTTTGYSPGEYLETRCRYTLLEDAFSYTS
ncbi:hypothetical protein BDZ89DRAFT_1036659 [Hymenopellis radicata]|nr:hypothetical protein BDZ89DRAFT_1036659 [Hymenopellis radicata]